MLLALVLGSGCYSFRAGTGLTGVETIAILPFDNRTTRLELTQDVQDALLRELPSSLGLRLAGEDQADVVVRGAITTYDLVAPNYRASAQGQAAEVLQRQVVLTVSVEILNMRERTVLWSGGSLRAQGEYLEASETEDVGKTEALEALLQQIVDGAQSNW
ncbi:LptE family protein [Gemmatimonadota bacterium Y43]